MDSGISSKDLNQIINRAISQWSMDKDKPVNTEINIFEKRYKERIETNPQIDIFEEKPILPQELRDVRLFLNDLESYRQTLDVDEDTDLSEKTYSRLAKSIDKYKEAISPENQSCYERISENIKRHAPEYKNYFLLKDCIDQAKFICGRKPKKSQDAAAEECARSAYYLLKRIMKSEDIENIKPCPLKIELYKNSLNLVDCLTPKKYRRTFKFNLKRDLNDKIYKCALALKDDYAHMAVDAKRESIKFSNAISNALDYSVRKFGEKEWAK